MCVVLRSTFQQAVVGLSPGVAVLAGQDAHGLFVSLPGLRPDPQQLPVDLTLSHSRAVAVVNLQLEELAAGDRQCEEKICLLSADDLLKLEQVSPLSS